MALIAIGDVGELKDWAPDQDALDDHVLERCLLASSGYIERRIGRVVVSDADITELHDGTGPSIGGKESRELFLRNAPIVSVTSVTENSKALYTVSGYTASADVIADLERGRLWRRTSASIPANVIEPPERLVGWAPGVQNISIVYLPGYGTDPVDSPPVDLKQAAYEVAWWLYKNAPRLGISSKSRQAGSLSFDKEIARAIPMAHLTINHYRMWRP